MRSALSTSTRPHVAAPGVAPTELRPFGIPLSAPGFGQPPHPLQFPTSRRRRNRPLRSAHRQPSGITRRSLSAAQVGSPPTIRHHASSSVPPAAQVRAACPPPSASTRLRMHHRPLRNMAGCSRLRRHSGSAPGWGPAIWHHSIAPTAQAPRNSRASPSGITRRNAAAQAWRNSRARPSGVIESHPWCWPQPTVLGPSS